jgi:hypothetical protein
MVDTLRIPMFGVPDASSPVPCRVLAAALLPRLALAQVGVQHFNIPDPSGGAPLEVGVWYPTDTPGRRSQSS